MVIDLLLDGLKNPVPAARIEMLRVLAMLEETQALDALRNLLNTETDPNVLSVLRWAGSLIWRAQQAGYSTEAAMRQLIHIEEPLTEEQKREEELLSRLQYQFDMDQIKTLERAARQRVGKTVVMGAFGAALVAPALGANLILSAASNKPAAPDAQTGESPMLTARSYTPQRPTTYDISPCVKRAHTGNLSERQQAIIELRSLNNPAALPYLGYYFALDPEEMVKSEAQRSGKMIYFNWVYWTQEDAQKASEAQASQSEVAKILAQAEAAREARRKK